MPKTVQTPGHTTYHPEQELYTDKNQAEGFGGGGFGGFGSAYSGDGGEFQGDFGGFGDFGGGYFGDDDFGDDFGGFGDFGGGHFGHGYFSDPEEDGLVAVYRVEDRKHPREVIDAKGNVSIKGSSMLFINIGDKEHAKYFLGKRRAQGIDAVVKTFLVPRSYLEGLRERSVSQADGRKPENRAKSQRVDETIGSELFGLPKQEFPALRASIVPGTGREIEWFHEW